MAVLTTSSLHHLPAVQETRVRFLGWKDPLENGMATHSSVLAWRIPCTVEPGGLQSMGSQGSDMTELLNPHHHYIITGGVKLWFLGSHLENKYLVTFSGGYLLQSGHLAESRC